MKCIKYIPILSVLFFNSICISGQDYYTVQPVTFNTTEYDELSPAYYPGGLVFCSNRKNSVFVNYFTADGKQFKDLYLVRQRQNQSWASPNTFSNKLVTIYHEGSPTFNSDGNKIYFTRNHKLSRSERRNVGGVPTLGIYSSIFLNGKWGNIIPFNYNQPGYNLRDPNLSSDNNKLFFSSDMPGGYGGFDIWLCNFDQGVWSQPVNLGPQINTATDELYPFFHNTGRLFFSSDKQGGMGGRDIYYSLEVDGQWLDPLTLQSPINSASDDFAFITDDSFNEGYFTSNRNNSDDIFNFVSLLPSFTACQLFEENNYCATFFEQGSMVLDTTTFDYEWDLGDGNKFRGLEAPHCYDGPGTYFVQLNVIDTLTGDILMSEATFLFELEDIIQVYINSPDTCMINQPVNFDGLKTNLPGFNITEYYWDFGDGNRAVGVENIHTFLAPGTYTVQLGVTSVPDNQGNINKSCSYKNVVVIEQFP